MKDSDKMPWGTHRGKPIGDVPFDYLLKYYRKQWLSGDVLTYFEKQLRLLEAEEERTGPLKGKKPKKYIIEDYECQFPYQKKEPIEKIEA